MCQRDLQTGTTEALPSPLGAGYTGHATAARNPETPMSDPITGPDSLGPLLDELARRHEGGEETRPEIAVPPPPARAPGLPERLGDYRIVREIGHGGMGV